MAEYDDSGFDIGLEEVVDNGVDNRGDLAGNGGGVLGTEGKGGLLELGIGGSVDERGMV